MIDLSRRDGRVLRVGHRGAAALARENTLAGFRTAVDAGVDLVELDVVDLPGGPLLVAHSHSLHEVSHGAATGTIRGLTLDDVRRVAPEVLTLHDALAFFAEEAPGVGVHLDLKLRSGLDTVVAAVAHHGLEERTVVSGIHVDVLRAVRRHSATIRIGYTYPRDRLGVASRRATAPIAAAGVVTIRALLPRRVQALLRRADATALMLEHRFVTPDVVARAHAVGAAVLAWTVDTVADLRRVEEAGVDGVITNDPGIFVATLLT